MSKLSPGQRSGAPSSMFTTQPTTNPDRSSAAQHGCQAPLCQLRHHSTQGDWGGGYGGGQAGENGGGQPGGSYEFGVDPNLDPELAMALRVSLEEERARQAQPGDEAAPDGQAPPGACLSMTAIGCMDACVHACTAGSETAGLLRGASWAGLSVRLRESAMPALLILGGRGGCLLHCLSAHCTAVRVLHCVLLWWRHASCSLVGAKWQWIWELLLPGLSSSTLLNPGSIIQLAIDLAGTIGPSFLS